MIIQDVRRQGNQQGRTAGSFRDGQFTRYVEVIRRVITITDSEKQPNGEPVIRHQNFDLTHSDYDDYQPLAITTTKSGIDGKLIVTLGGFTVNGGDSRRVSVKTDLTIKEPWEVYE